MSRKKQQNLSFENIEKIFKKFLKKVLTKRFLFGIIYKSSTRRLAGMAQSVEHVIGNDEVISSILITSSKNPNAIVFGFLFFCFIINVL